jgi:hypothetical protein
MPMFTGDFEMGWLDWSADRGVWQVGRPTSGPGDCYEGDSCAGTVLDGNYHAHTDSRLISATVDLSKISISIVYMQFWEWFSFSSYDQGNVQISVWDSEGGEWSSWESLSAQSSGVSNAWTLKYVDLSNYSDKRFRIGFYHQADRDVYNHPSESHGWFIDKINLVGPDQIIPTISNLSYSGYIPDPCTSLINVLADEPFGGELTYMWQLPDGGTIQGPDPFLEFIPPEIRVEPYTLRVAAWSEDLTHLSSFTKTLNIFTEVLYDYEPDGDIDGADLRQYVIAGVFDDLERFAQEFGLVACQ